MKNLSLVALLALISCGTPRDAREGDGGKKPDTQNQGPSINDASEFSYRYNSTATEYVAQNDDGFIDNLKITNSTINGMSYWMKVEKKNIMPPGEADKCQIVYVGRHDIYELSDAEKDFLKTNNYQTADFRLVHSVEGFSTPDNGECKTYASELDAIYSASNPMRVSYFFKRTDDGSQETKVDLLDVISGQTYSK